MPGALAKTGMDGASGLALHTGPAPFLPRLRTTSRGVGNSMLHSGPTLHRPHLLASSTMLRRDTPSGMRLLQVSARRCIPAGFVAYLFCLGRRGSGGCRYRHPGRASERGHSRGGGSCVLIRCLTGSVMSYGQSNQLKRRRKKNARKN
jgi:hypothetical protein